MAAWTSVYVLKISLCVLALSGLSKGTKCFHCEDLHYNGSTGGIDAIKTLLNRLRNTDCPKPLEQVNDGSMGDRDIDTTFCGTPPANKVYKCGYLNGRLHASYFVSSFPMNIFVRNCLAVDKDLEDGCYTRKNQPEDANYLNGVLGTISSFGFADFVGEMCVCSGDMCYPSNDCSFPQINMHLLTSLCAVYILLYSYMCW